MLAVGLIASGKGYGRPRYRYDQDDCRYCLNRREVFSQIGKEWTPCPRCQA